MSTTLKKQKIIETVEKLPDDEFTLEEIVERLILLHKVQVGLEEKGKSITQEKVRKEFEKQASRRSWR